MNRKIFASALSFLLLSGTAALARGQQMDKSGQEETSASAEKSASHTYVGTVKEFETGKLIKVMVTGKLHTFKLHGNGLTATVDPSVAVGSKVKVVESKGADGMTTVTVTPEG